MEWLEALSDDLKANDGLKKFESVDALAKSYVNLESLNGNSIRIPSSEATAEVKAESYQKIMNHMPELMLRPNPDSEEQMTEFHRMLGVPESDDGYVWEGEGLDGDTISELRKLATDTNMTKTQWKAYVNRMAEMNDSTHQMREDSRVRMGAELKTEWGMAFEDRYAVAEKFISEHAGLGSIENMAPEQIKEYYEISKSLIGKPQAFNQPPAAPVNSPAEALAKLAEIKKNPVVLSTNPADRFEQQRLLKLKIELMKQSDPVKYG